MSSACLRTLAPPYRAPERRYRAARLFCARLPVAVSPSDAIVVIRVELRCLACGRAVGILETPRWPWLGPALLHAAGGASAVSVANWTRLRCATCGGNAYPDEVSTARVYPTVSWDGMEPPRRGRPPRSLVAQRDTACNEEGD